MGRLIYSMTTSMDGFVSTDRGDISWSAPTEEVLGHVNDVLENVGTFLLGRRLYETLAIWDIISSVGLGVGMNRFAEIWRGARKVVYSNTLAETAVANSILERTFDTAKVSEMVRDAETDTNIGGPLLASRAIAANLVDEYHQYIVPLVLGGGTPWMPKDIRASFELVKSQAFDSGVVHNEYRKT